MKQNQNQNLNMLLYCHMDFLRIIISTFMTTLTLKTIYLKAAVYYFCYSLFPVTKLNISHQNELFPNLNLFIKTDSFKLPIILTTQLKREIISFGAGFFNKLSSYKILILYFFDHRWRWKIYIYFLHFRCNLKYSLLNFNQKSKTPFNIGVQFKLWYIIVFYLNLIVFASFLSLMLL